MSRLGRRGVGMMVGALSGLLGCAGAEAPKPPAATVSEVAPATPPEPGPSRALRREDVRAMVQAGLARFLQRIELDDRPVRKGGAFYGYRVVALRGDPSFWQGVDLGPGDVVTKVNGFSIERPEDALRAFESLLVASELRVDYERGGEPRTLRYAIVDE